MKKIPFIFQGAVRDVYFDILTEFIKKEGLTLSLENDQDVILSERFYGKPTIVAIIDSHSTWGEPNDLTNEFSPRTYDGLKIILKDIIYKQQIDNIADNIKRNLEEEVVVEYQ